MKRRNPLRACACACGGTFRRFDTSGRPRRYLPGHNSHGSPKMPEQAVNETRALAALVAGERTAPGVAAKLGVPVGEARKLLARLVRRGEATKIRRGEWTPKKAPRK